MGHNSHGEAEAEAVFRHGCPAAVRIESRTWCYSPRSFSHRGCLSIPWGRNHSLHNFLTSEFTLFQNGTFWKCTLVTWTTRISPPLKICGFLQVWLTPISVLVWKTTAENVEKETRTKFTACTAVKLSAATVSAENMSQRAIWAASASLRGFALFQQNHACVPRSL